MNQGFVFKVNLKHINLNYIMINKIDIFLSKAKKWQEEMTKLREIVLSCGLDEVMKWYQPCYTFQNSNIVIISGFKDYCLLGFFKGALLKDTHGILTQPTENVQAGRQLRFTSIEQITELEETIKSYIYEAVEIEKAGLKIDFKKTSEFNLPEEFKNKLDKFPELKSAFEALTPGRQRAYLLHFSQPKQSKTRESRIEKYIPWIIDGKGLND